uniref:BHLH transcription factor n=1 Tax=Dracaena cambodiana TaxID=580341 RepID=A0A7M3UQL5_9ASPA|nr:bHLH transcription factor [Dracaena cambodiana]
MYQHQFANPLPTTISYSVGSSNSSYEGFDHPVQGINNHCFDPNTSTLLHMLNPGNFHHDGFISEVPVDSVSAAASAVFYDPTIFHSVPNHGGGGSLVFEEGYGGRVNERMVQLGNKRKKKGFEEGAGGLKNEKQRRERLTNKFEVLKKLIPNPTKPDRATIIADTISYIQELLRTIDELKLLVEKKRRRKSGSRVKPETGEDAAGDMDSSCVKPLHRDFKGTGLRSSWLQRKSKDTHVDVRILEDEVFIKLSQHRKIDCLPIVARVLDELELEMLHLSGGNIGDLHAFIFNTKIHEGSSVYAGAIAKKIIEAMDVKHQELFVSF